jgi:hypothetical protein
MYLETKAVALALRVLLLGKATVSCHLAQYTTDQPVVAAVPVVAAICFKWFSLDETKNTTAQAIQSQPTSNLRCILNSLSGMDCENPLPAK